MINAVVFSVQIYKEDKFCAAICFALHLDDNLMDMMVFKPKHPEHE